MVPGVAIMSKHTSTEEKIYTSKLSRNNFKRGGKKLGNFWDFQLGISTVLNFKSESFTKQEYSAVMLT